MISKDLLDILACPACAERPPVRLSSDGLWLVCDHCQRQYPVKDDIPIMLVDAAVLPAKGDPPAAHDPPADR